jgi:hypothetical protein
MANMTMQGQSSYTHTFKIQAPLFIFVKFILIWACIVYVDTEETQREITSINPSGSKIILM